LHKAKELFSTTDLNVTEVTFSVGFKNLEYFSREFTREFGKTPSEFGKWLHFWTLILNIEHV
jgi:AraC-like DNA-binding protein